MGYVLAAGDEAVVGRGGGQCNRAAKVEESSRSYRRCGGSQKVTAAGGATEVAACLLELVFTGSCGIAAAAAAVED